MSIADDIVQALAEHTWLTAAEMGRLVGRSAKTMTAVANRMCGARPKLIYCAGHVEEDEGCRKYPRPFYALGDLRCRARPPRPPRERHRAPQSRQMAKPCDT